MTAITDTELEELRSRLDEIDNLLRQAIRDRLSLCQRIADYKKTNGVAMMQPDRIKIVHDGAAAFAAEHGIDPGFLRRLYDLVIAESCRLETDVIGHPPEQQPHSGLAASALRIDHVAIAVRELESAIAMLSDQYGFELVERRRVHGEVSGMFSATMRAGGVTFVLCQGDSPRSNVSQYIAAYGPGVQHIALEVTEQEGLVADLVARKADLLTRVLHAPGLDQTFTKRDANTGIQLEFVSRNNNIGFDDNNVRELFTAMERENVF